MRTRTIKPEFWTDEKLAKVSRETRLFFAGLWTTADDQGVTHSDPVLLRSQIFPYDDIKIEIVKGWISDLISLAMLIPYEAENGENYLFIRSFPKYQKIDHPAKTQYNPTPREGLASLSTQLLKAPRKRAPQTEFKQNLNRIETETETKNPLREKEHSRLSLEFENLWKVYPQKREKANALKEYQKLNPQNGMNELMLAAIEKQIAHKIECDKLKQFCPEFPYFARWLKKRKWDDVVSAGIDKAAIRKIEEEEYARNHPEKV